MLVVGSGAREHALTWKFSKSRRISGLFVAPGNAGTGPIATNVTDIDPLAADQIARFAHDNAIDLVVIGPEDSLAAGVVDQLMEAGVAAIGPTRKAAQLESSKSFSSAFMTRHGIPTPESVEIADRKQLDDYLDRQSGTVVLKKSGLAQGKGVLESADRAELERFADGVLGDDVIVAQEFLTGYELSVFVLLDGSGSLVLPLCSDFKKAYDDDEGPNTGGMGSIAPVPWVGSEATAVLHEQVIERTLHGMREEELFYRGVLFIGVMMTDDGPKVLEYNVRFGDPETQVLMPVIGNDLSNLFEAVIGGSLDGFRLALGADHAVCVVVAADGYPGAYEKGIAVEALPPADDRSGLVFHASTTLDKDGTIRTGGGRSFSVVGLGSDSLSAMSRAYELAEAVKFDGAWYRTDIGRKFFIDS